MKFDNLVSLYLANRRLGHTRRSAFKWAKIVIREANDG